VLSPAERAGLAEQMLKDVLRALSAAGAVSGIALYGNEPRLSALPEAANTRLLPEAAGTDYRVGLAGAAAGLAAGGARSLLVVPGDLPLLTAEDVESLLGADAATAAAERLSIAPAAQDGGSNGLVLTPPTDVPFLFGPDSARRHEEAAAARGIPVRQVVIPGFARDIDTPEDLRWLLSQRVACATLVWLRTQGIADRLRRAPG
jgi:2-phospho-L-lactate guanylyltransferase